MCTLYIKKIRHLRRMSQKDLALRVGCSQQYIALIEADNVIRKRSPRLDLLERIAIVLQVCFKDLVYCDCSNCELKDDCKKKNNVNLEELMEDNLNFYI